MDEHQSYAGAKVFKYKLDFYYQQALLYLVTLVLYAGVRGTFTFERLPSLDADPILYIIIAFVVMSMVVLMLNRSRDRKLIVVQDRIVFHSKRREREVLVADVEWMHVGREPAVRTAGQTQVIIFKTKNRRRLFRIRVGRYERDRELVVEMQRIAQALPKVKSPTLGMR